METYQETGKLQRMKMEMKAVASACCKGDGDGNREKAAGTALEV